MRKLFAVLVVSVIGVSLLFSSQLVFTDGQDTSEVCSLNGEKLSVPYELEDGFSVETFESKASFEYRNLSVYLTENAKVSFSEETAVLSYGAMMISNSSESSVTAIASDKGTSVAPGASVIVFAVSKNGNSLQKPDKSASSVKAKPSEQISAKKASGFAAGMASGLASGLTAAGSTADSTAKTSSASSGMRFSGIKASPDDAGGRTLEPAAGDGVKEVPETSMQNNGIKEEEKAPEPQLEIKKTDKSAAFADYNKAYFGVDLYARLNFVSTTKIGDDLLRMLKNTYWSVAPFFGTGGFKLGLRFNSTAVNYFWFTADKTWRGNTNAVFNIIDEISYKGRRGGFAVSLDRKTEFGFTHVMDDRLSRSFDFLYSDDLKNGTGLDLRNESSMALSLKGRTDFIDCDLYTDTVNFARETDLLYGGARVGVRPLYLSKLEFGLSTLFDIYQVARYDSGMTYSPQFYPSLDFTIPFSEGENVDHLLVGSLSLDASAQKGSRGFAGQLAYRADWEKASIEAGITANVKEMLSRALDNSRILTDTVKSRCFSGYTILDTAVKFGYTGDKSKLTCSMAIPIMVGNSFGLYRDINDDSLDKFAFEYVADFSKTISMDIGIAEHGIIGRLKDGEGASAVFSDTKDSNFFVGVNFYFGRFKLDAKLAYAKTKLDYNTYSKGVYVTVGGKYSFGGKEN